MKGIIDQCYKQTIDVLNSCTEMCIPYIAGNVVKPWWNSLLSELKRQAIISHNEWIEAGKPRHGPIYENRTKIKLKYKLEIKQTKTNAQNKISNDLQESLMNKNQVEFWKTWKNKI
jgi:hypothetical protein